MGIPGIAHLKILYISLILAPVALRSCGSAIATLFAGLDAGSKLSLTQEATRLGSDLSQEPPHG